jgi:hypothetical protein
LKRRLASGTRTTGNSDSAAPAAEPNIAAEATRDVLRINSLLFISDYLLGLFRFMQGKARAVEVRLIGILARIKQD